jgi:hypothetical protein
MIWPNFYCSIQRLEEMNPGNEIYPRVVRILHLDVSISNLVPCVSSILYDRATHEQLSFPASGTTTPSAREDSDG